jgi:peptidoglycan-associated lipoprotein
LAVEQALTPNPPETDMTLNIRSAALAAILAVSTLGLAGSLGGCATSTPLDEPAVESRTPVPPGAAGAGGATSAGTAQSGVSTVNLGKPGNGTDAASQAGRVIYFDYDSFVVKEEFRPMLEANAKALAANRSKRMVAEGHTDERGGSEYNLALGQKRAEAVVKSLVLLGVLESQVEAVSFGKERPVAVGGDEADWAKNRRVELKAK